MTELFNRAYSEWLPSSSYDKSLEPHLTGSILRKCGFR